MTNALTYFFLLVTILMSCKKQQEKTIPIIETISESVYASGIVKSKNQYKVFSTVNGLIDKVLVTEGDTVSKGDVIIKLQNSTAALNTENATIVANFNAVSANTEKLSELQVTINIAKAKMNEDALLQTRQQKLWNDNIGSKNELELRQLTYKNSLAAYNASKLKYTQLQKFTQFQSKQSQKNVEISTTIKNDYNIKSNANGRVYNILMKKGEMVNTLSPVAIIGDSKTFEIELQVDENDIGKIKLQQKVYVTMDSYKGLIFEAFITKINPTMNERTKTFTINADYVSNTKELFANLTCEANILISKTDSAITIPRSYLLNGDTVLLKNNKKLKVITGVKDYKKVQILSGLTTKQEIYKPT